MPKRPAGRRCVVPRDRCEESAGNSLFSCSASGSGGWKRSFAVDGPPSALWRGYEIKRRNLKGYSRVAAPRRACGASRDFLRCAPVAGCAGDRRGAGTSTRGHDLRRMVGRGYSMARRPRAIPRAAETDSSDSRDASGSNDFNGLERSSGSLDKTISCCGRGS